MSSRASAVYEKYSNIGVITLDNPPVNALSPALLEECIAAIEKGEADSEVQGFLFVGADNKFSGGADITAFKEALKPGAKNLPQLLDAIERSKKIFVAAIDGIAFGGGLELALTCDYRCATPAATVGLPEIKLGLLPGAGGTQRLPRLIGQQPALEIILSGDPVAATRALQLGILDEIIEGSFREGALSFASKKIVSNTKRRLSALEVQSKMENIEAARATIPSIEQGGLAHHKVIDCVATAAKTSFAEGLVFERNCFQDLYSSTQAQAKIHLFFAERAVSKIPNLSLDAKPISIKSAAVIGAGTMGNGIATNFLNAGIPVTMIDTSAEFVARGKKAIEQSFSGQVKKGKLKEEDAARRLANLQTATDYEGLRDVDIFIEAVFENMKIKQEVFKTLSGICRPDAILATNTSTLDIDEIASAATHPERIIGMHFFSPANIMKLLEVVRGGATSDTTIVTAMAVGKLMKKVAVLVGNCDGFVGNRMLNGYVREAEILLEEGALPEQVDRVMTAFGFAMGPFAVGDLAGIDVHARIRQERNARGGTFFRESNIANLLYEKGRYGQKTSAGWYRYEPGNRKPIVDEFVTNTILEESKRLGVERKTISDEEIVKRCLYPLVNEGARILEEGMAIRASDIDIIYIYGYGFPAFRGGPMFWADSVGLKNILSDLKDLQKRYGDVWEPAPLLEALVENEHTFADFIGG
jgi:3-hydroxyacyl-CoA dehydrogenase